MLKQAIMDLPGKDGKPIFCSVKCTAASDTEGRYLILFNINQTDEAHEEIDNFLEYITTHLKTTLCIDGIKAVQRNQLWKDKEERDLANALARKYGSNSAINTPNVRRNHWDRKCPIQLQLVTESDNKFPHLTAAAPATKKPWQADPNDDQSEDNAEEVRNVSVKAQKVSAAFLEKLNAIKTSASKKTELLEKQIKVMETTQADHAKQVLDAFQESNNTAYRALQTAADAKESSNNVQESLAHLTNMILTINPNAVIDHPEVAEYKRHIDELTQCNHKRCSESVTQQPSMAVNPILPSYDDIKYAENTPTKKVASAHDGASHPN